MNTGSRFGGIGVDLKGRRNHCFFLGGEWVSSMRLNLMTWLGLIVHNKYVSHLSLGILFHLCLSLS